MPDAQEIVLVPGREYLVSLLVSPTFLAAHPDHSLVTNRRMTHVRTVRDEGTGYLSWAFRDEHQRYQDLARTEKECWALNTMSCACVSMVVDDDKWYIFVHPHKVKSIIELPFAEAYRESPGASRVLFSAE